MAKTELTKQIEKAFIYYEPARVAGIKINVFRGRTTVYEVPAVNGTSKGGMIDIVRICEYFESVNKTRMCRLSRKNGYPADFISSRECPLGHVVERTCCDNESCEWNVLGNLLDRPAVLISCYEIKVTKADFKSKNGHNFVGNHNFYIVPDELYSKVADLIPAGIGVILYSANTIGNGGNFRKKVDPEFRSLTESEQKWLLMSAMKRMRRGGHHSYTN